MVMYGAYHEQYYLNNNPKYYQKNPATMMTGIITLISTIPCLANKPKLNKRLSPGKKKNGAIPVSEITVKKVIK